MEDGISRETDALEASGTCTEGIRLVKVYDGRPESYEGSCLRPLGLCELGGSCDLCWYSPEHPRFKRSSPPA